MLVCPPVLHPQVLRTIADLERCVLEADGGRLKLEWKLLEAGVRVEALLFYDGDCLVGFCGLYAFGPDSVEVTGMVAPQHRQLGIGTALLSKALGRCRHRGVEQPLLVVPRASSGGKALAVRHGGVLDHSEHALVLEGPPRSPSHRLEVGLRRASLADESVVSGLLEAAFGHSFPGLGDRLREKEEPTIVVELGGAPVGTVRLSRHGDEGGIYGFAVDPAFQGRGIGREVLARACEQLRIEGAQRVALEVAIDNDRALGLYTSVGFSAVSTEDYYAIPAGDR